MFQKLIGDYKIPAQLAVQGPDGQWQLLAQQPYQAPQQQAPDVRKTVQEILQEERVKQDVETFGSTHPHYETVRGTMAGLLQSGLAENLEDAYEAALRHPRHADIYEAQQQQLRGADEKQKREESQRAVRHAKANVISPRSSTPSALAGGKGERGLRDELSEAYDETAGRV
jgi:hypothetical protein